MKASPATVDRVVKMAQSAPDLLARAQAVDPALASNLTAALGGQAKTQWGRIAVGALAYLSMKYGLGWPDAFDEIAAGAILTLGHFASRYTLAALAWLKARAGRGS